MPRKHLNDGMEVIFQDHNELQGLLLRELYDRVFFEMVQRQEDAFFGDGFSPQFASSNQTTILKGVGFQSDGTVALEEPQKRMLYKGANALVTHAAPDGVNDRIDIIVVSHALVDGPQESRKFKSATSDDITAEQFVTSKDWDSLLEVVAGTPAASPAAPAVPAGKIQIAQVLVSAVTGIANAAAVTDTRTLMPVGALTPVSTLGFLRLTAGAATPTDQLFQEIDALLKDGRMDTNIFTSLGLAVDAPAPAIAKQRVIYNKDGILFVRESDPEGGAISPLGSGAGGGGSAVWRGNTNAPVESYENDELSYKYSLDDLGVQRLTLFLKVPSSFIPGRQVQMFFGAYSPGSAGSTWNFQATTSLVRIGQDAVGSVANQNIDSADTDLVSDLANKYQGLVLDLTNGAGQINGFSVQPGDLLKIDLRRSASAGTEETEDVRFLPNTTEIKFG